MFDKACCNIIGMIHVPALPGWQIFSLSILWIFFTFFMKSDKVSMIYYLTYE